MRADFPFESDSVVRAEKCGSGEERDTRDSSFVPVCSLFFFLSLSLSLSLSLDSLSPLEAPAGPSRCLDLPFCCNRLLNLPLIPRLSRFFSSFFHLSFPSFHLFVASLLLLVLPFVVAPFCTLSSGLSPAPFAGQRYAPTGFELSRILREGLLRCEIKPRS